MNLLRYLKYYKKETVLSPALKLSEAVFELLVPLVTAQIIDVGVQNHDFSYIVKMTGILILFGAVGLIFAVTAQYFAAKAAVCTCGKIREALYEKINSLSFGQLDKIGTSTLITRMTDDINQVQTGLNLSLRLLLRSPLIVFGAMIMAFRIDVRCALLFCALIPLLACAVFTVMLLSIPRFRAIRAQLDTVTTRVRENLTGVRVLRAFLKENNETEKMKNDTECLYRKQTVSGWISATMNPVTYVLVNAAVIALIWQGGVYVSLGSLSQGQVIALYNYMSQILVELIKLANLIINITKSISCAGRIRGILELPAERTNGSEHITPQKVALRCSDVGLCYNESATESLSNINLCIYRGETVGFIGGTGSGKSSLMHVLSGFYPATRGEVCVFGTPIQNADFRSKSKTISMCMQKPVLFSGTIRDNITVRCPNATEDEITQALEISQSYEFVSQKENGVDYVLEQNARNLSGGQKQRLCIARALIGNPEILIFDDSVSALDQATEARFINKLHTLPQDTTVLIVSQRISSIRGADRIFVMNDGEIVAEGTHTSLMESCEIYREICASQEAIQ